MPPLAHRNLKAANVLLDEDLTPRICDCCLAALKPLTINSAKAEVHQKLDANSDPLWFDLVCVYLKWVKLNGEWVKWVEWIKLV